MPRGDGCVTRCPLLLSLIHCPIDDTDYRKEANCTDELEEWGVFEHKSNEIFGDFDDIRKEIEEYTEIIAGGEKGIKSTAISLTIYSPKVVNLTLVDLPGLTKV